MIKLKNCFHNIVLTIAPHTTLIIDTNVNYRQLLFSHLCSKYEVNNSYKFFEKCELQTFSTKYLTCKQFQVLQNAEKVLIS